MVYQYSQFMLAYLFFFLKTKVALINKGTPLYFSNVFLTIYRTTLEFFLLRTNNLRSYHYDCDVGNKIDKVRGCSLSCGDHGLVKTDRPSYRMDAFYLFSAYHTRLDPIQTLVILYLYNRDQVKFMAVNFCVTFCILPQLLYYQSTPVWCSYRIENTTIIAISQFYKLYQ